MGPVRSIVAVLLLLFLMSGNAVCEDSSNVTYVGLVVSGDGSPVRLVSERMVSVGLVNVSDELVLEDEVAVGVNVTNRGRMFEEVRLAIDRKQVPAGWNVVTRNTNALIAPGATVSFSVTFRIVGTEGYGQLARIPMGIVSLDEVLHDMRVVTIRSVHREVEPVDEIRLQNLRSNEGYELFTGDTGVYSFDLVNFAGTEETVFVDVECPLGWDMVMDPPSDVYTLESRRKQTFRLSLEIPPDTVPDVYMVIRVTARAYSSFSEVKEMRISTLVLEEPWEILPATVVDVPEIPEVIEEIIVEEERYTLHPPRWRRMDGVIDGTGWTLRWEPVPFAEGYTVYRDGSPVWLGTGTMCILTDLVPGLYTFTIRSWNSSWRSEPGDVMTLQVVESPVPVMYTEEVHVQGDGVSVRGLVTLGEVLVMAVAGGKIATYMRPRRMDAPMVLPGSG